jgi:hypothetical protein
VRRADRITGAVLLAFAIAFSAGALKFYTYSGPGGPGSAFLPFWLGILMAVLALMLLASALREPGAGPEWLPRGEGRKRLLVVLGVTIALVALLKVLGMMLGTALFLIVLLRLIDRSPWPLALSVAALTSGLNYLVFTHWLRVPFPVGVLGF